jgi:response regulator RpfG family c-di-GMP phosphodiesterase
MDGLAVARALRRDPATRALPVLAVSASASDYTREEAMNAGCSDFLPKPIRSVELLDRLRSMLDLEWIVEPAPGEPVQAPVPADARIDAGHAAELSDLAMKGEVKALISRAEAAMEADPEGAPVYEELRRLARSFDMKAVRRRLDDAREVPR